MSMRNSGVTCPECQAGYRRIELKSKPMTIGEFRCLMCDHPLETFDGCANVALRLTVQPARKAKNGCIRRFQTDVAKPYQRQLVAIRRIGIGLWRLVRPGHVMDRGARPGRL
jgi:hypothetical protein